MSSAARALLILDAQRSRRSFDWSGQMAGVWIHSELPCALLLSKGAVPSPPDLTGATANRLLRITCAQTAGRQQRVHGSLLEAPMDVWVSGDAQLTRLEFDDGTVAVVAAEGDQIDVLARGSQWFAVVWGPVLLLALARRGIFCLHASALLGSAQSQGAIVVCADSGQGKSTLARAAAARGGSALVDDLCPVQLDRQGRLCLLPRFPQLKWCAAQHWPEAAPHALPVQQIGVLQRGAVAAREVLDGMSVLRMLLQHTVASRLFEPPLLQAHLLFCARVAQQCTLDRQGSQWTARNHASDPAGAMLELLHLIEPEFRM